MIVFVIAMVVFIVVIYAIVQHEEEVCREQLDDMLKRELSQEECKNIVVKLKGLKLTPAEEWSYPHKISDDTRKEVGEPGVIEELSSRGN